MPTHRVTFFLLLLCVITPFTACTEKNGVGLDVVTIAEPNWASGRAMAGLIAVVSEEWLGAKVEIVPGSNAVVFQAMDRGNGQIDVHPDVWLPNQINFTSLYVDKNKTVKLSNKGYEGFSGFCVPRPFAEKHNIKSIFDLSTPEVAALMDRDGDGKGDIWIGAPGWTATKKNTIKIRDYGINNFFNAVVIEEEIATATIANAFNKNEGFAFYCYAPHYNWFVYDMVPLEEPDYDENKHKMVLPNQDPDWFEKSKITTGDKASSVHVGYSITLDERNPSVAAFLKNIQLDTDTVNFLAHEVVIKKRDSREVAREWIAENIERVDSWLGL